MAFTIGLGVDAEVRDVAVDEAGERGFVVYDDGSVEELDLSDRSNISSEDTLSLTNAADLGAAAYVEATSTLIVVGEDSNDSTGTIWTVDCSVDGTLTEANRHDTGTGHPTGGFDSDSSQAAEITAVTGAIACIENVGAWLVETDGAHSITVASERLTGTQNEPSACAADNDRDVAYFQVLGGVRSYDISGGTLAGGSTTDFGQDDRVMSFALDDDRLLAVVRDTARGTLDPVLLLLDVSDRSNISELDQIQFTGSGAPSGRDIPAVIQATDRWYVQRTDQDAYFSGGYGGELTQENDVAADFAGGDVFGHGAAHSYTAQDATEVVEVVFGASSVNTDSIGTLETVVSVGPTQPSLSVDAAGEQAASLASSSYSHPDDTPHKDSKWQVRLATDSDWTSPEYDSGFVAEDLEEHTASPLDIDEEYEARVIHRDENDLEAASDPVAFSTTGESKQGEGPEGLFFGEENGNRLFRFGRVFEDAGSAITAVLESNHIAPAGAQGEAVFRSIHLTIEVGTELDLTFTPIVDGTEVTNAEVTHTVEETSRVRRTLEVALMQDVTDSTGTPVAKVGLRGSWFGVKIKAVDQAGFSPRVSLESLEVEVELVRESAGSVNESA